MLPPTESKRGKAWQLKVIISLSMAKQFFPRKAARCSTIDENSGRTDDGVMPINWVWRKIRKVILTFPPLTSEELSELVGLVQGQEYDLTYPDPADGSLTIRCYTSNATSELKSGVLYGGLWVGVSFNAIEMEGVR